ncbi:MAG: ribosome silencing factor [Planctomycetota bacterium]
MIISRRRLFSNSNVAATGDMASARVTLCVNFNFPPFSPHSDFLSSSESDSAGADPNPMVSDSRVIHPHGLEYSRQLATVAARVALENNGRDVVVLDVSEQSAEFDFFVLATGSSRRQLHAISEQTDDALEKGLGETRAGIEGYQESSWIVLDYGNIVIHLFDNETREYYDLESLWADGKRVPLEELGLQPNVS